MVNVLLSVLVPPSREDRSASGNHEHPQASAAAVAASKLDDAADTTALRYANGWTINGGASVQRYIVRGYYSKHH